MEKSLTKHGNSLALLIEKPILDLLGANADTLFDISTDGHALILTPIRNPERKDSFNAALNKTNQKYAKALRKLAE